MSKQAKAYWLFIVITGLSLAIAVLIGWRPGDQEIPRLGLYMLAAVATSGLKVRLPGIFSNLSVNYVFVIAGLSDLHLAGGIIIGFAIVFGQSFYKFKTRPQWWHVVFNLAQVSLAVSAASVCIGQHALRSIDPYGMIPILGASISYFAVNTLVLSGIIGFTSGKPIIGVWRESFLWTSPQYLVGGVIAQCFRLLVGWIGWEAH